MSLLKPTLKLSRKEEQAITSMNVLGDKTRFKIFKLLVEDKNLCVSEIADRLNISVPAVSQHFKIFELTGLVERRREGQKTCYHLNNNDKFVNELTGILKGV